MPTEAKRGHAPRKRATVGDSTYASALLEALDEIENELSELGFDGRYPVK